jgi:hypothetical protein
MSNKNLKKGRNSNKEVLPFDYLGSHFTLFEDWQIIVKSHKKFCNRGRKPPAPP